MKKVKKIDDIKLIEEVARKMFALLGTDSKFEIVFDKETDIYNLNINAEENAGLLIGKRGDTINSIQILINQILRQKKGEWLRVVVNIADFREKENNRMVELANQTADRVRETGTPQNLYNLTPSQRRIVHLTLAEEKDLLTESVGEGIDRYLVVSMK